MSTHHAPGARRTYGTTLSGIQLNATATAVVYGSTVTVAGNFTYAADDTKKGPYRPAANHPWRKSFKGL